MAHLFLAIATSYAAVDRKTDETARALEYYLAGMLAERQKICSGEFVVTGTKSARTPDRYQPELDYSGKLLIKCAFDGEQVRCDNLEPDYLLAVSQGKGPGAPEELRLKPIRANRKYIRTPTRAVAWLEPHRQDTILIARPPYIVGELLLLDVQALGMASWRDLIDGTRLEGMLARLQGYAWDRWVDGTDPAGVQLVFSMETATQLSETRYWLRPEQGFTPVRMVGRVRRRNPPDNEWQVITESQTAWQEISGVWLPVKFDMRHASGTEHRITAQIRWRSVNQPIDERRFDWHDFGPLDTTKVIDFTGPKPVMVQGLITP
ncbi:MAG TPA: hypothetical protein VMF30_02345 [Pirellulales bacterium]|nr:hypothetical protein [Pirellulales bacterium]